MRLYECRVVGLEYRNDAKKEEVKRRQLGTCSGPVRTPPRHKKGNFILFIELDRRRIVGCMQRNAAGNQSCSSIVWVLSPNEPTLQ